MLQNVKLRLSSLPPPRGSPTYDLTISTAPHGPELVIKQLTAVKAAINNSLDVIDVTTWTGDAKNADFVAGQMKLLQDNIQEARQALKGYSDVQMPWWEDPIDEKVRRGHGDPIAHARTNSVHCRPSTLLSHPTSPSTFPFSMPPCSSKLEP